MNAAADAATGRRTFGLWLTGLQIAKTTKTRIVLRARHSRSIPPAISWPGRKHRSCRRPRLGPMLHPFAFIRACVSMARSPRAVRSRGCRIVKPNANGSKRNWPRKIVKSRKRAPGSRTANPDACPISAGSMSTASVGPAVKAAAEQAKQGLIKLAQEDRKSPIYSATTQDIEFKDGKLSLKSNPSKSESFTAVLQRNGNQPLEATAGTVPQLTPQTPCHSSGAVFVEVAVDPDFGTTRVKRVVAVYDVGRIINRKTAESQFIGGIIWGISLALHEETHVDWRSGRIVNANLADYRVPVNSDIGAIEVSAIDVPDFKLDSIGARGVGEIGITGTGAAVANAIFHATGRRVRNLPITPEKLV